MTIQTGVSIHATIEDLRGYEYGTRQASIGEVNIVCMIALLNALDQINQNLANISTSMNGNLPNK